MVGREMKYRQKSGGVYILKCKIPQEGVFNSSDLLQDSVLMKCALGKRN